MITLSMILLLIASHLDKPALGEMLKPLAEDHDGDVAIAVLHLETGQHYYLNADTPMPTASLIKLPILTEVYRRVHDTTLSLNTMLTLTKENSVIGSGILHQHFSPGATFSLKDTAGLMIAVSDNSATNMILDVVTMKAVNDRMELLKLPHTKVYGKVFLGSKTTWNKDALAKYGLGSTTAREMVTLLQQIYQGKIGNRKTSDAILTMLKTCDDTDKFPRFLPKSVTVAHKTGSVNAARTDAGILYFKGGPVAICVLTNNNKDTSWTKANTGDKLCADVAKVVYDYYKE